MKINLNIDENERKRILEMHNSAKSVVSEQNVASSTAITYNEESKPARMFIHKEFGIGTNFNPNYSALTKEQRGKLVQDSKEKLKSIDMNEMVNKAKAAGVSEESIMALQKELETIAGRGLIFIKKDEENKDVEKPFVDGKLGTNTIAAYLDHMIYVQSLPEYKGPPSTPTTQYATGAGKGVIKGTYQTGKQ
jgi:hypothetical protein